MKKRSGKSKGKYERYKASNLKVLRKKRDLLKHVALHPNDKNSIEVAKKLNFLT